jgi:hypothetical protein
VPCVSVSAPSAAQGPGSWTASAFSAVRLNVKHANMQAFAPWNESVNHPHVPQRSLIVLACVSKECSDSTGSFRAIRCQGRKDGLELYRHDEQHGTGPPDQPGIEPLASAAAGERQPFRAEGGTSLSFDDLLSQLDQMEHASKEPVEHAATCAVPLEKEQAPLLHAEASTTALDAPVALPEFWFEAAETSGPREVEVTDDHIRCLVADYEAAQQDDAAAASSEPVAGEPYESSSAYDKFYSVLRQQPAQCVRCALLQHVVPSVVQSCLLQAVLVATMASCCESPASAEPSQPLVAVTESAWICAGLTTIRQLRAFALSVLGNGCWRCRSCRPFGTSWRNVQIGKTLAAGRQLCRKAWQR